MGTRPSTNLPFEVIHTYGPVESTLVALSGGIPIPNASIYLLGEDFEAVPDGTVGEIYIGGAGVARGYRRKSNGIDSYALPKESSSVPAAPTGD
jgi:non-ribosomal peptide synthetase component F